MPRTKLKLPAEFDFSTELRVRVSDVNYAGHLSNDKMLAFMHEARARYFAELGFTEMDVQGTGTIQTETLIIYKSEAFQSDILEVQVAAGDFHNYGCDFFYRLNNVETAKEIARGKTGMVFFDYNKRKMALVPPIFLERVRGFAGSKQDT